MSEPMSAGPERIDLRRADDPRDVIHRAVECLSRGGVALLPTESGYGVAASLLDPDAVGRVRELRAVGEGRPWGQVVVRGPTEVMDWVGDLPGAAFKLIERAWPGPLTIVLEGDLPGGLASRLDPLARSSVCDDHTIGLCCPAYDVVRHVRSLTSGPILLAPARPPGGTLPVLSDQAEMGSRVDLIIDDGPIDVAARSTVVRWGGDGRSVVRAGAIDEATITRYCGTIILFICTGNTCRSPMAEAIFRGRLAARLGCAPEALEGHGFTVLSAGLSAGRGLSAASNAVQVVRAFGGSLDHHASRQVTAELVRQADLVLAMTRDHLEALIDRWPEAAAKVRLVDPAGDDVDDPIGSGIENYRATAETLDRHLRYWIGELIP